MNWITLLFSSQALASGLITASSPEPDRIAFISKYVTPPPGASVPLDAGELRDRGKTDPLRVRGFITIAPPKGECFTVTRNIDRPDTRVCKKTRLSFTARDLARDGSITWTISTGAKDPGFSYQWTTPHRLGQVIKAMQRPETLYEDVLIVSCFAEPQKSRRRIQLKIADGRLWQINLPQRDTLAPQPQEQLNLFVDEMKESHFNTEALHQRDLPDHEKARKNAPLKEHVTTYWAMPARHAYTMSADGFRSTERPDGLKGTCRYRFQGAPQDPESGWIECHETAEFDVVLLPLSCASQFK